MTQISSDSLQRVHHAEGIALERQRDLNDAGAHAVQRLRGVRLGAFGRHRERGQTDRTRRLGEILKFLQGF